MSELLYPELSYEVQGAFYEVYKSFGSSFKESVYQNALVEELKQRSCTVQQQKRIDIFYRNKKVGVYVPDLVVNEIIIIELKSKPMLTKNDIQQFWHYLRGSDYKVGYLVNFGTPRRVELIRRVYDSARRV